MRSARPASPRSPRNGLAAVPTEAVASLDERERLLRVLAAATFLIFFQAYMVAPLIPRLSAVFHVSAQTIGLIVPAYMVPYGVSILFYGLLSDRIGRRRIMLASLLAFILLTAATATAPSASQLISWRLLTGLGASGVVPLALALMGDLYPFERRGRPSGGRSAPWLAGWRSGRPSAPSSSRSSGGGACSSGPAPSARAC